MSQTNYCLFAGTERVRKFMKRDAVPSIFTWTKESEVQSSRAERQTQRLKSQQQKAAKEWRQQDEERQRKIIYTDLDLHVCQEVVVESDPTDVDIHTAEEIIVQSEWGVDSAAVPVTSSATTVLSTAGSGEQGVDCLTNISASTVKPSSSSASFFFPLADGREKNTDDAFKCESSSACKLDEKHVKKEPYLSIDAIKHSDELVHFYTGLETWDVFMHAFWSLGDNVNYLRYAYSVGCKCLSPVNQFLLMLVKLRRHYPHFELARMFEVCEFTVQNVFVTWVNFCYCQWKEVDWWPHRSLVSYHCPVDFKMKFPSTRVIVDATEIRVKQPSNPKAQRASFSNYKHANTMKVLVGVTPGGLTSFVSDAFGGSSSDRQIVERTTLTELCDPHDSIMVDKGFNVQDIFAARD